MTENQIQPIQNTTFVPDIRPDLSEYSLDKLASLYDEVDQHTKIYKGIILLEAKKRFPSNIEFGTWCNSVQTLCLDSQKSMNRCMNLAAFFHDKDMNEISVSACYEISSPNNAEVAEAVYEKFKNEKPSVAAVKEFIQEEKLARGIPVKIQKDSSVVKTIPDPASDSSVAEIITDPKFPYSEIIEFPLDEDESKFQQDTKDYLDENGLDVGDFLVILEDYCYRDSERKPSLNRLHDILELISYLTEIEVKKKRAGASEPLDNNTVSLQVPGTNHKQQRNDLCACGSGLKYKKCCLI